MVPERRFSLKTSITQNDLDQLEAIESSYHRFFAKLLAAHTAGASIVPGAREFRPHLIGLPTVWTVPSSKGATVKSYLLIKAAKSLLSTSVVVASIGLPTLAGRLSGLAFGCVQELLPPVMSSCGPMSGPRRLRPPKT
jgi:hypothetical protein